MWFLRKRRKQTQTSLRETLQARCLEAEQEWNRIITRIAGLQDRKRQLQRQRRHVLAFLDGLEDARNSGIRAPELDAEESRAKKELDSLAIEIGHIELELRTLRKNRRTAEERVTRLRWLLEVLYGPEETGEAAIGLPVYSGRL